MVKALMPKREGIFGRYLPHRVGTSEWPTSLGGDVERRLSGR